MTCLPAALLNKRVGKYEDNVGAIDWRDRSVYRPQSGRFALLRDDCSFPSIFISS
jgi:hypothetical protein